MTAPDAVFREATAQVRVAATRLADLSIELGQVAGTDFAAGPDQLRRQFRQVAPWVEAARRASAAGLRGRRARVSSYLLIHDYLTPFGSPASVLPVVLQAAHDSGLEVDYLVRDSGCAEGGGAEGGEVTAAQLVEARLVADPPPGTNGSRPPTTETGWLCNGQRSPSGVVEAMAAVRPWAPPVENAAGRHSIFVDVELWDQRAGRKTWSHPFLAAAWQLLRLDMIRYLGQRVAQAEPWLKEWPQSWDHLPAIISLNQTAEPFTAYRTLSILPIRLLPVEHAVHTILGQVAIESGVAEQVLRSARTDDVELPPGLVDRVGYVFTGTAGQAA